MSSLEIPGAPLENTAVQLVHKAFQLRVVQVLDIVDTLVSRNDFEERQRISYSAKLVIAGELHRFLRTSETNCTYQCSSYSAPPQSVALATGHEKLALWIN